MPSGSPDVSVIVAVRNAPAGIRALLDALQVQTLGDDRFEVIVVDDRSTDHTAAAVRDSPAGRSGLARVIVAPVHGGAYAARNLGLAQARGRVLAVTDADCRPAPDWLEHGLAELEALGADLLGGHIEVPLPERPTAAEVLELARFFDQRKCVEEWGYASTSNLLVRREVLDAIGPFNDRMISGGDAELSRRATAAGRTLRYSQAPVVVTDPRRTATSLARKCFRLGFGVGQMAHVASGPVRESTQIWRRPRAWVPRRGIAGAERLAGAGYRPSRRRVAALHFAQYGLVQLPLAIGNLVAALRRGRAR